MRYVVSNAQHQRFFYATMEDLISVYSDEVEPEEDEEEFEDDEEKFNTGDYDGDKELPKIETEISLEEKVRKRHLAEEMDVIASENAGNNLMNLLDMQVLTRP